MKIDRAGFYGRVQEVMNETSAPAIGRRLGLTKQAVYAWERKGVIPEADVLEKIAGENSISLHWLLTGQGNKYVNGGTVIQISGQKGEQKGELLLPEGMTEAELNGLIALAKREGRTPGNMITVLVRRELQQTNFIGEEAEGVGPLISNFEELIEQLDKLPEKEKRAASAQVIGELMMRSNRKRR